jgi:hypothetical protein
MNISSDHETWSPTLTKRFTSSVPWALERILERRGMGGNIGVLEEREELLRRIINVELRLLAQHDAECMTPYAFAWRVQASIQSADSEPAYNGLGSIIKNAIFERLKDPEDWRRALYCKSGEIIPLLRFYSDVKTTIEHD